MARVWAVMVAICFVSFGSLAAKQPQRWAVAYDFVEQFSNGTITGSPSTEARNDTAGGIGKSCIFQHPPLETGALPARLTFETVPLPQLAAGEALRLHGFVAMSDRISLRDTPDADGCEFVVRVDDREVFRKVWSEQRWFEWSADLTGSAGSTVRVVFEVNARANSVADWAMWGEPRIEIVGRPWKPREGPKSARLLIERLAAKPVAPRTYLERRSEDGTAVIAVMDPYLDLPMQLQEWSRKVPPPHVPLAPTIVVGEGDDPENHTLIRVLGEHGIAVTQFLAYPPHVRGGVQVALGKNAQGAWRIVAAPITDRTCREVKLFDLWGIPVASILPDPALKPPYAIACGDFHPNRRGHEIALVAGGEGRLYTMEGSPVASFRAPGDGGRLSVARQLGQPSDALIVFRRGAASASVLRFGPPRSEQVRVPEPDAEDATGVWPSAFGSRLYATWDHPDNSSVAVLEGQAAARVVDVGAYENLFWYQWYRPMKEGRYVRSGDFAHIRTDLSSEAGKDPARAADPSSWTEEVMIQRFGSQGGFAGYLTDRPKLWEPCFTHRQPKPFFEKWLAHTDPESGLALFPMLTRNGRPVEYGEFGSIDFYASSYGPDIEALDNLYTLPLRSFLRKLAVPFRQKPEHCAGLEPNHEHEIAVEADGSMGDYNLAMIAGFFDYLRRMHGTSAEQLNQAMGTPFDRYFDAPRNWGRGPWDAYDATNAFYKSWTDYNRYVVSRRVAETFREALLAGFPPEIVKCHQIPDTYAIGNLQAFSDITARFTPIDWMLNAGTGFGFTRYGVWYNRPHDALQDAHSSGFDAMSLGEYQALTPDKDTAYRQLRFLFDNGCVSVHCMLWPQAHDRGYNQTMHEALARLVSEDRPRPGLTGGVGQIRPYVAKERRFDIACIGTGPSRTGLLKSLNADGSWEGSVYVVPFHAHVEVKQIATPDRVVHVRGRGLTLGPLSALDSGEQIEITAVGRAVSDGKVKSARRQITRLRITVLRNGRPLPGLAHDIPVGPVARPLRYILRCQLPVDGVALRLETTGAPIELTKLAVYRESEQTTKLSKGRFGGKRHRGGVTFDVVQ